MTRWSEEIAQSFHSGECGHWLPFLPEGVRIYAVGDVHGRADLMDRLFHKIDHDLAKRPIVRPICVFLGDYVDRGPKSCDVIDSLIRRGSEREFVFLRGNHEAVAIRSLTDVAIFENWMRRLGGLETLVSYGIEPKKVLSESGVAELQLVFRERLPDAHLRFLNGLQSSFSCGKVFFAHAGVKPGVALSRQSERDLLWIRDEFLSSTLNFEKLVVHGHTPVQRIDMRSNRINIDTGAFVTGHLTCLIVDREGLSVLATG
ncbi:serine/threonine protein phosphatase [Rhodopseudomonas palustris]|uniref:Serine/threonine protein phosphatase n=1 Tax=Rhodopseudomonas palustris TaxID=1076 RepID=A0A323UKY5_RHOPL|nr:metallophosphoesterase family protein [Rhodopseudomonas palustris]PZA12823.1 serine/threonine protein phosphatase [Rhodopseudomonas palustris]